MNEGTLKAPADSSRPRHYTSIPRSSLIPGDMFARHKFYLCSGNDRAPAAARDQFRSKIDRRRCWQLRNDDDDDEDGMRRRLVESLRPETRVLSISTSTWVARTSSRVSRKSRTLLRPVVPDYVKLGVMESCSKIRPVLAVHFILRA